MNTNNNRRALLGAIAASPLLAAAGVASAASPAADLAALDEAGVLEVGSRNADPAFARACAAALLALVRYEAAWALYQDAEDAACAIKPDYPAGLIYRARYTPTRGPAAGKLQEWSERHVPLAGVVGFGGDGVLWNLAHWYANANGGTWQQAAEILRGQYAAWKAACDDADTRFLVHELEQASDVASEASGVASDAVIACPAHNADALLVKLRLRLVTGDFPTRADGFAAMIVDVQRVSRST